MIGIKIIMIKYLESYLSLVKIYLVHNKLTTQTLLWMKKTNRIVRSLQQNLVANAKNKYYTTKYVVIKVKLTKLEGSIIADCAMWVFFPRKLGTSWGLFITILQARPRGCGIITQIQSIGDGQDQNPGPQGLKSSTLPVDQIAPPPFLHYHLLTMIPYMVPLLTVRQCYYVGRTGECHQQECRASRPCSVDEASLHCLQHTWRQFKIIYNM